MTVSAGSGSGSVGPVRSSLVLSSVIDINWWAECGHSCCVVYDDDDDDDDGINDDDINDDDGCNYWHVISRLSVCMKHWVIFWPPVSHHHVSDEHVLSPSTDEDGPTEEEEEEEERMKRSRAVNIQASAAASL